MKQELAAYLFQSNGQVSEMPTDELLGSLERLRQAGITQELGTSADNVAIHAFLQSLKRAMRTARSHEGRNALRRVGGRAQQASW